MKRVLISTALVAVLSSVLVGCGDDESTIGADDPGIADTAAVTDDFCVALTGVAEAYGAASADDLTEEDVVAIKAAVTRLVEVGVPEDMSGEAREGFELSLDSISDLSADDLQDEDAMKELEEELSGDDKAAAEALQAYITDNCDLGVPTE